MSLVMAVVVTAVVIYQGIRSDEGGALISGLVFAALVVVGFSYPAVHYFFSEEHLRRGDEGLHYSRRVGPHVSNVYLIRWDTLAEVRINEPAFGFAYYGHRWYGLAPGAILLLTTSGSLHVGRSLDRYEASRLQSTLRAWQAASEEDRPPRRGVA